MNDSDGKSPLTLTELITETGPFSESGGEGNTSRPQDPKPLNDFHCRTFAFIGGEEPHFIFSSAEGNGRLYVSDKQIALSVEDGSRHIGNLVRGSGK